MFVKQLVNERMVVALYECKKDWCR